MKPVLKFCLLLLPLLACGCGETGYRQTNGAVSFVTWDEAHGRREHPVAGADSPSFQVLNPQGYAKDRSAAYFRWTRIAAADPVSFNALSERYASDSGQVFYEDRPIPGAQPASFVIFEAQWARDRNDVYLQSRPIGACDPPTFVLLAKDWQRDSRCVYNRGRKLADADPSTFAVLNFWYGKDDRHVYHSNTRALAGADASTFSIAEPCEICGKDAQRCYRYGDVTPCGTAK